MQCHDVSPRACTGAGGGCRHRCPLAVTPTLNPTLTVLSRVLLYGPALPPLTLLPLVPGHVPPAVSHAHALLRILL